MIVELYAKSDVGRVRRGNEDNFLVLDLSTEQTWTGADGATPPQHLTRFDLAIRDWYWSFPTAWEGRSRATSRAAWQSIRSGNARLARAKPLRSGFRSCRVFEERHALRQHRHPQEPGRLALRRYGRTFTGAAVKGDSLTSFRSATVAVTLFAGPAHRRNKDQSLVQQLVDVGQISESEAETHMFRNVILQALGAQSEDQPVTGRIRLHQGDDLVLLCSDGLSGKLRAEDIQQIVNNSKGDLAKACEVD